MRNLAGRSTVGYAAPGASSCGAEADIPDQTPDGTRDMEQHLGALGLPPEQVNALLTAAGQAPSLHNSQPWRFRIRGDAVDVLADRTRQPFHRWRTANARAMRALLEGRLEEAERLARGALEIVIATVGLSLFVIIEIL
mgnify:CR=1 FL=1